MQRVFRELVVSRPSGNVVLSPHAVVLGLLDAGAAGDENQRAAILRFLDYTGTWSELQQTVARVSRVSLEGTAADQLSPAIRFQYESVVRRVGNEPLDANAAPDEPVHSAFNRKRLERVTNEHRPTHLLALFDSQVAGVPMLTQPLFRPVKLGFGARPSVAGAQMSGGAWYGVSPDFQSAFWAAENDGGDGIPSRMEGRAVVSFSLPTNADTLAVERLPVLPCDGGVVPQGGSDVSLDFRAPTFCALTNFSLSTLVPELGAGLPLDVELAARLAFDERGTINLPERATRSPSFLEQRSAKRARFELAFDRPFFVALHDRISGALLYVGYVREPGEPNACH